MVGIKNVWERKTSYGGAIKKHSKKNKNIQHHGQKTRNKPCLNVVVTDKATVPVPKLTPTMFKYVEC